MSNDGTDALAYLAVVVIGFALIVWGLIIIGLLWFSISAVVAAYRYKKYLREANEEFEQVMSETGADLPVDEILRATYGAGIELPENGFDYFDWFEATVIGVRD